MLVGSDSGRLVALNPETGRPIWRRTGIAHFSELGTPDLVIAGAWRPTEVMELAAANTRWSFSRLPLQSVLGWQSIPDLNVLVLVGPDEKGSLRMVGATLDSGIVLWSHDTLFSALKGPGSPPAAFAFTTLQPMLRDTDSTGVFFPEAGGAMRLELRTGRLLWRAHALASTVPLGYRDGFAALASDGDAVFVAHDKRVSALDLATGTVRWTRQGRYPSHPARLVPTARGLLVHGYFKDAERTAAKPFIDLLDTYSGESRWRDPQRDVDGASALLVIGDTVLLASTEWLMRVDVASGEVQRVALLERRGGDRRWRIERRDAGLAFWCSGILGRIGASGGPQRSFFPAPGPSTLARIAATALSVAIGVGAMYAPPGTYVAVPSPASLLPSQRTATIVGDRYLHLLTEEPAGSDRPGATLVRVDKDTGKEVGRVWLAERKPVLTVDHASGTVYLLRRERSVEAFRF